MRKTFSLSDLEVYQEALLLVKEIFHLCSSTKLRKEYSLCDQIKRASISICANIAEGYGRKSKADFSQFLSISLGSCNETMALLDIIKICFPDIEIEAIKKRYLVLSKRLYSFRKNLK